MVHASDTDVLVLAIATARMLKESEIWLAFGRTKNFQYIAAHSMMEVLGDDWFKALLFMHAISGCDSVSSFCGIGKKTVWDIRSALSNLTALFVQLSQTPQDLEELERLVVPLYSRTSQIGTVNAARKHLFSYGNRKLENIPPSRAALLQHVRRAAFQAGHIWGQAPISNPDLPCPSQCGWRKDSNGKWYSL